MKLTYICSVIIILYFTCLKNTESSKILGVFTSPSKSHVIIQMAVAKALVEKGHNVTIITTIPLDEPNIGYRHIKLSDYDFRNTIKSMVLVNNTIDKITSIFSVIKTMGELSNKSIKDPQILKLMKEETFDLLLLGYFFNDFFMGLGAHFKCPTVVIWVMQPFGLLNYMVGNPSEISHASNFKSTKLNFFDRILNFFVWLIEQILYPIFYRMMRLYYEENFPLDKYPTFDKVLNNISLILCNQHFSEGPIRANVPAIIEIGGIQSKEKPDILPKDIMEFLDNSSKDGAIFFSLGSNVQSSDLNTDVIGIIFKVLSSLKQNVIWKWEDTKTPGISKNILFKKWLPQDDILAHTNLRLFITHCGKGSITESQYHGVPMVGLPVFGDQLMNIKKIESMEFGIGLNYRNITENSLKSTIMEVLENQKYSENIKRYSKLYRDRPMSAKATAIYWIEYVIRYGGVKHMQSDAVHLNIVEYLMLDVLAFLLIIIYIWYKFTKCVLKFCWRKIRGNKNTIGKQEKLKTQ